MSGSQRDSSVWAAAVAAAPWRLSKWAERALAVGPSEMWIVSAMAKQEVRERDREITILPLKCIPFFVSIIRHIIKNDFSILYF